MEKTIKIFHYISFIKYPLMLLGVFFSYRPLFFPDASPGMFADQNTALIFIGLALSLDSLKDYNKLTWLDKKVYHRPKVAQGYFFIAGIIIAFFIGVGIWGYFIAADTPVGELSFGLIVLAIGMIGLLKSGIDATMSYIKEERK